MKLSLGCHYLNRGEVNDMGVKEYLMPNGKTVAFEYDENRIGKITLEAMDRLMEMIGAKEIDDDSNT